MVSITFAKKVAKVFDCCYAPSIMSKKTAIGIENDAHEQLKKHCDERYLKMGPLVSQLIREYLERERRPMGEEPARPARESNI